VLNLGATGLFAASLALRRARRHEPGRGCALLGYLVTLAAAYLGGDLVYTEQIGVDHAAGAQLPAKFTRVLAANELAEGEPRKVMVGQTRVLLVREGSAIRALADTCSHLGGPLSEGELRDGTVICPWHGSRFSLRDGRVVNGPATHPQPCMEARIRDGHIEIRMAGRNTPAVPGTQTDIAA
jgi:nitrite reductase/ring-hydroxylating ferredoxin subunit